MDKEVSKFKKISLTGRLCYLFMCIEKYLVSCYPDKDWTMVAKKCWQWTNGCWDEGCDRYSQVIPRYLFEFDNYYETNEREFDGELSESDYRTLINLYDGITDGSKEDEIDQMLTLPIDFNNICEGTGFSFADESTLKILLEAQSFLLRHNIECPSVDAIHCFTIDQKNGWGEFVDSEYLSIILK